MKQPTDIEKVLAEGNILRIRPRGYSMYPLFVPGRDEVLIEKTDIKSMRRGDVVLYRRTGSILVLHRIWKREGASFYMVGDNQKEIEGPILDTQIKGKMIAVIRKGKHISVQHPLYRLYSSVWLRLRPFRPGISRLVHKIKIRIKKQGIQE